MGDRKRNIFGKLLSNIGSSVPAIDLNRYTDLEDMYGYIGFIDKDGGFYRVRKIGSRDCGHGEWAYYFLDSKKSELGIRPSLKFYENIHALIDDPRLEMAFLYESSDSSMGEYSQIAYSSSVGEIDMSLKQKEVINSLIEYQNKKEEELQKSAKAM